MAYLYKEQTRAERAESERHLHACPECQAEVARWRAGMEWLDLDSASLVLAKENHISRFWQQPALRWAAAAAVVLSCGFGMGRLSRPSEAETQRQLAEMRESITREVQDRYRQDLQEIARATVSTTMQQQQEWFATLAHQLSVQQAEDQKVFLQAIDEEIFPLRTGMLRLAQITDRSISEFASLVSTKLSPEENATNSISKGN